MGETRGYRYSKWHVRGGDWLHILPCTGLTSILSIFSGQNITFKTKIVNVPTVSGKNNTDKTTSARSADLWLSFGFQRTNHRGSILLKQIILCKEVCPTKSAKIVYIPWNKCQHFQIRRLSPTHCNHSWRLPSGMAAILWLLRFSFFPTSFPGSLILPPPVWRCSFVLSHV